MSGGIEGFRIKQTKRRCGGGTNRYYPELTNRDVLSPGEQTHDHAYDITELSGMAISCCGSTCGSSVAKLAQLAQC